MRWPKGQIGGVVICAFLLGLLGGVGIPSGRHPRRRARTHSPSNHRSGSPEALEQEGADDPRAPRRRRTRLRSVRRERTARRSPSRRPVRRRVSRIEFRVVEGDCEKNLQAPGLVVALGHLVTNYQRHLAHEADKAAGVHGNSADNGHSDDQSESTTHGHSATGRFRSAGFVEHRRSPAFLIGEIPSPYAESCVEGKPEPRAREHPRVALRGHRGQGCSLPPRGQSGKTCALPALRGADPDAEGNLASSVRQDDFDTADDRPGGIDGGAVAPASSTGQADSGHPREFEVAFDDLVRGYEVERDRFVMVTPEEIVRARPQPSHTIDLEHFVRLEDIDPLYFEKSYYLAPRYGTDARKPYALLLRTMQETGRAAIGRFVLRTKPHLVAIRAANDVLALETMYFGDEVRDSAESNRGSKVSSQRLVSEMAEQFVF